jgi:hypothetical protein
MRSDSGQMGLGVTLDGAGAGARFGHAGSNEGFTCNWVALQREGRAAVVMTNADTGWPLIQEIILGIAHVYNWPEAGSSAPLPMPSEPSMTKAYVGLFTLPPAQVLSVTRDAMNRLWLAVPGQTPLRLMYAEGHTYLLEGSTAR